jgi:peptide/nickel transport system ATP-binding protein
MSSGKAFVEVAVFFLRKPMARDSRLSTQIAVMRSGKFVEVGAAEEILRQPAHLYTRELLAAVPELLRV